MGVPVHMQILFPGHKISHSWSSFVGEGAWGEGGVYKRDSKVLQTLHCKRMKMKKVGERKGFDFQKG